LPGSIAHAPRGEKHRQASYVIQHASASNSRHISDALVNLRVVAHHAAAEVGRKSVRSLLRAAPGAIIAKDFGDFISTRRQERVVEAGKRPRAGD